ncbi:hypothetical protein KGF54_004228 [Candida jiufengensis]|uniref:uncharacterized protein n=1 Tax=Candida jiufengensis TaxID=497108 RepID=UPI002225A673|nr:uncharacterized protein KGF54_004228 [Candida jiufengensis]KAI5951154.1 hypothetical protein KGF54_004228 [Candida jiufengensis]
MEASSSTISLNFNYDQNSNKSLFKLWKLTNDLSYINCSKISSTERLNNRSWRLMNQRILKSNTSAYKSSNNCLRDNEKICDLYNIDELNDLYNDNITNLKPKTSQFMSNRPSLFSHSSNLSLYTRKKSTSTSLDSMPAITTNEKLNDDNQKQIILDNSSDEDIDESDMSDIPEISDNEEEVEKEEKEEEGSEDNINDKVDSITINNKNICITSRNLSVNDKISPKNVDHKGSNLSMFESKDQQPQATNKPQTVSKSPSDCSNDQIVTPQPPIQRQNSLFSNFNSGNTIDNKSKESITKSSRKPSYETVDETNSSAEEVQIVSNDNNHVVEDDDEGYTSTDISEVGESDEELEEDEEEEQDCLEIKHSSEPKNTSTDSVREDNESEWMSVYSSSVNSTAASGKSIPKQQPLNFTKVEPPTFEASTETLSSLDKKRENINPSPSLSKPKSLLSGLFTNDGSLSSTHMNGTKPKLLRSSTTGVMTIDQEYKRPSIIFTRKYPSLTDIPQIAKRSNLSVAKTNTIATSSELIIDKDSDDSSSSTPIKKQGSIVGISDINVSKVPKNPATTDEEHELLSSSLNKLSKSVSHHSLINLLSKSSINLSRLYITSKNKLRLDTKDQNQNSSENNESKQENKIPNNYNNNYQDKKENSVPSLQPTSSDSISKQSPSSLASSSSILINCSKNSNTPPPPIKFDQDNNPSFIPTIPKITTTDTDLETKFTSNEELSKSIKESLIIDNKLGKVAMPDKSLVKNLKFNDEHLVDEEVFDDYHSKGW